MLTIKKTVVITVQQQTRPTQRPRPPLKGERSTRHARRYEYDILLSTSSPDDQPYNS